MRRIGWMLTAGLMCSALLLAACGSDDGESCTPTAQLETEATCADGVDNDCDGFADDADSDCAGDDCTPTAEVCDGQDNDCDQQIDEELTQDCVQDGQTGFQVCQNGAWGECQVEGPPPVEICNGEDDNNNGQVDEGLQQVCNTACGDGIEQCIGGQWAQCDAPQPETETCNERDDDCDGQVDEELTRVCESVCGQGEETCSLGSWVGCTAPRPAAESCDNVDNDCDGQTDEDLSKSCTTDCGEGASTCTAGQWSVCTAREPDPTETCGDGIDNDCNGVTDGTDEGCVQAGCDPGTQANCRGTDAQLLCQNGIKVCNQNREFGPCQLGAETLAAPTAESCNGRDDDCDGGTDETFPTKDQACGGGPGDAPLDEGECQSGTIQCVGGQIVCQDMIAPAAEICDGLDNDCDGETDNAIDPDAHESNDVCTAARTFTIAEDGGPRVITGTLYPEGDVDMYLVRAEEASSFSSCFAWPPVDNPYEVYFALYNIPEGVDYDLCVTIDWAGGDALFPEGTIDSFCAEPDPLVTRTCFTEAVDGIKGGVIEITEAVCGISDDIFVQLEVVGAGAEDSACEPYTLTIEAVGLPAPE